MILETLADVVKFEKRFAEQLRRVRLCAFVTAAPPPVVTLAKGLIQSSKTKNLATLNNGLGVKYYLAGKQRLLNTFTWTDYTSALRFADLVIHLFAEQRTRRPQAINTDDAYNLGVAQVQRDLTGEPQIVAELKGLLVLIPDRPPTPPRKRKTVSGEIAALTQEVARLNAHVQTIEDILEKKSIQSEGIELS